jgi:serine/threonine-protein kinase
LLAGWPPFEGKTPHHVMVAHLEDPVPSLRGSGQVIPEDLEAVIVRCLEKDSADRFPDVISLEQALADCQCAGDWTESEAARAWQRARRARLGSAASEAPPSTV